MFPTGWEGCFPTPLGGVIGSGSCSVIYAYVENDSSENPAFLDLPSRALGHWRVLHRETCVGDTHTGHNIETWKGAIEKNSLFDVVSSVVLLLCLCANHSLSIRDT